MNETETIILCICICIALIGGGLLLASVFADARDAALDPDAEAQADEESINRAVESVRILLAPQMAMDAQGSRPLSADELDQLDAIEADLLPRNS